MDGIGRRNYNRDAMRKWRAVPANHQKELARKRTPEVKQKALKNYLWLVHRVTIAEYEAQLVYQGGHCALCARMPDQEHWKRLSVDHDHSIQPGQPGYFRGLLCNTHNVALGVLGDDEKSLLRALAYIRGDNGWQT